MESCQQKRILQGVWRGSTQVVLFVVIAWNPRCTSFFNARCQRKCGKGVRLKGKPGMGSAGHYATVWNWLPRKWVWWNLELFVAIMSEIWNARNRFIFKRQDSNLSRLSTQAVDFLMSYEAAKEKMGTEPVRQQSTWRSQVVGVMKMNFDAGKMGEDRWGRSFVLRSLSPIIEEAKACMWGLQAALEHGYLRLIVEGDCLLLIQILKQGSVDDTMLGLTVRDILEPC